MAIDIEEEILFDVGLFQEQANQLYKTNQKEQRDINCKILSLKSQRRQREERKRIKRGQ